MFRKTVIFLCDFIFCHLLYRVKYIDKDKLEKYDRCVVCPNHSNTFEPFWIYVKNHNMWIMAKAELFKNKLMAKLYNYFNVFPIRRGQKDVRSIVHSIRIFDENEKAKLLMFPEGTRIPKTQERGRAKTGAIYIASKAKVPIVPVYITKNAKLFSSPKVIYGDAIEIPDDISENKEELRKYADILLDRIYDLKNKIDK